MLDVQNRLPTPGKENRVKITQDSGAVVEGVLSYADDATQDGTFWNRKNGQLLQGDIRELQIRDGESINVRDVVNVGRELISGTTFGELSVGSTVQINEGGTPIDYLVVHQGKPSSMYDDSCDGTWLLRKDLIENRVFDSGNVNKYEESDIHNWLNSEMLAKYDADIQSAIKQVKIPYRQNGGYGGTDQTGSNGLLCKLFLLSGYEVGFTTSDNQYFPVDGAKLSYFVSGTGTSANNKRIAYLNGSAKNWSLRSPYTHTTNTVWYILLNGEYNYGNTTNSRGIRPCIIMDSSAFVDTPTYDETTVYRDVTPQANVENAITSTAVTATDTCYLNETYSIAAFVTSNNTYVHAIYNKTGKTTGYYSGKQGGINSVKLANLNDYYAIMSYSSGSISVQLCKLVNTSLTLIGNGDLAVSSSENNHTILSFSESLAILIYNYNGLKCKLLPINLGTSSITTSGTVYSLSSNTGANYISACKLPDDSNGNKRVCIVFADTSDGGNGKAVIATIDSSNAVTFGDVATIYSSNFLTHNSLTMWDDSTAVVVNYTASNVVAKAFTIQDNIISQIGNEVTLTSLTTAGSYFPIIKVEDALVVIESIDGSSRCQLLRVSNNVIEIVQGFFSFNNSKFDYCSATKLDSNHFIVAYADGGNSNYGTTTILEVSDNKIAGSFVNNSKDAIALASGSGGDIIPVGFGGYCQCDGVTEGQQITSDGVIAFSLLDGWLDITDARSKQVPVTGSFTATTTLQTINLGFKPSMVICYSSANNAKNVIGNTSSASTYRPIPKILSNAYIYNASGIVDNGFTFETTSSVTVYYIAWR